MRETVEELLASKGADKHAKDNVMRSLIINFFIRGNILQEGNEPQFYLSQDFSTTKKQTKGPEPKKVSMASLVEVQEDKKTSQSEEETVSLKVQSQTFLF